MIRRSTLVYILLLLVLAGTYYFLQNREQPAEAEETASAEPTRAVVYLFPAEDGTPSSIRIEPKSGESFEMARDAEDAWMLTEPVKAQADPSAAEAAAGQVATIQVLDSGPGVDPKIVGLEVPEYVLTIKFTGGVERTVEVGMVTPSESGYYVRQADGKVIIVSRSAIDALLGLLQNPPYLETPTPSPVPATESTIPTPTPVVPSATATP